VLSTTLHGGTNNHGKTDTIIIVTVVVKAIRVEDEQQYRQQ
jgi:hypothetical protein